MINAIARRLYLDMGSAPARLAFLAIPTAIVWYIARHAIVWFGTALMWIAQQPAPKDADFALGETIIATLVACLTAALLADMGVMMRMFESVARAEGISPILLAVVTPAPILGWFALLAYPLFLIALPIYVPYLIILTMARFFGARRALATYLCNASADVIDIGPQSAWRVRT